jgi:hypothetical protein
MFASASGSSTASTPSSPGASGESGSTGTTGSGSTGGAGESAGSDPDAGGAIVGELLKNLQTTVAAAGGRGTSVVQNGVQELCLELVSDSLIPQGPFANCEAR